MQSKLGLKHCQALFFCLMFLGSLGVRADVLYQVEPSNKLCAKASIDAAYNTKLLKVSKYLLIGKNDWLYRSNSDLNETFELDQKAMSDLRRFSRALSDRGTTLLVVYQPTRGLINPAGVIDTERFTYNYKRAFSSYSKALQQIASTGIIVPDLAVLLGSTSSKYYYRRDSHWTPYGAKLTAELVAKTIKDLPLYPSLPKTRFKTSRIGLMGKADNGTHQMASLQLCGSQYPKQYVDEFKTEAVEVSETDLFADPALPDIVVAGTSFTKGATNYNFVGYLKEFLSTDILNVAQAGGGVIGSLIQYLPSDDFQAAPSKLLIWEIPSYTRLSNTFNYRQIVPLVNNGCIGKAKVLSKHMKLTRGNNEVLFNGGGKVLHLLSADYLLDIKFNQPDIKQLKATVWYHNARKEKINLKHRNRVDADGRFVLELRSDVDWGKFIFTALDIELDETSAQNMEVSVSMCRRSDRPLLLNTK